MMIWPDCVALSAKDDYKDVFNMVYWQPVNHCHLEMKYVFNPFTTEACFYVLNAIMTCKWFISDFKTAMNNFQPVEAQSNGKWNFKLGNVAGKGLKHNDDIMLLGTPELPPESDEYQF